MGSAGSMRAKLLAIVALAGSSILAFDRSFESDAWILPALLAGVAPVALIAGTRTIWRRAAVVASSVGLCGVAYLAITLVPTTTFYGLPTQGSTMALSKNAYQAIVTMRTTVVPITPGVGHLALLFGWCWLGGIWSALCIKRGVIAASAPWVVAFVYASLIGVPKGRGAFSIIFLSATAFTMYVWGRSETQGSMGEGLSPSAKGAAWAGLTAIVGAVVITPFVPGFGSTPLVELGEPAPGGSGRLAPFSQIRSQLDEESSRVMFTVDASAAAYWRLTSLEHFDGRTWRGRSNYTWSNGEILLAGTSTNVFTQTLDQEYRIQQLRGNWLPAAHAPLLVEGARVRVDAVRHILRVDGLERGDRFKVTSVRPTPTLEQVRSAKAGSGSQFDPFLEISRAFAFDLSEIAHQMSQKAQSDYEVAVAIQEQLRTFTYSLDVPARHDAGYIMDFLTESRTGYCEQFAGAMALLLRSVGIPSRVAVGFLPGTENDGRFTVTNQEAHAWTEGYFEEVGWLSFEPTPRSEAEPPSYTRDEPTSASPGSEEASNSASPAPGEDSSEDLNEEIGSTEDLSGTQVSTPVDISKRAAGIAGSLLIAVAVSLVLVKHAWIGWWTAMARSPSQKVAAVWRRLMVDAELLFRPVGCGETESEYLAAVAARFDMSVEVFDEIRSTELKRAYGPDPIDAFEIERTVDMGLRVRKLLWRSSKWWDRIRLLASPSPWLRVLGSKHLYRRSG